MWRIIVRDGAIDGAYNPDAMMKRIFYVIFGVLAVLVGVGLLGWALYDWISGRGHVAPEPRAILLFLIMIGAGVTMSLKGVLGRNPFLPDETLAPRPDAGDE